MQGPRPNTLQNDGVHGRPRSTLHGACENGMGLIRCWCQRQALAGPAATKQMIATTIAQAHRSIDALLTDKYGWNDAPGGGQAPEPSRPCLTSYSEPGRYHRI